MLNLLDVVMDVVPTFIIYHALDYYTGGLVTRRHNEACDVFRDLSSLVQGPVHRDLLFRRGLMMVIAL